MKKYLIAVVALLSVSISGKAQYMKNDIVEAPMNSHISKNTHKVEALQVQKHKNNKTPKNIIFLIGDGMGVAQVFAGITANNGSLYLDYMKHIGFSKTQSSNNYVTDSAAGGTALSCGKKTKNGMIGMTPDSVPVKTILEIAEELEKSTGLVSTSAITHATPASFIAHQPSRNLYENIAADFLKTDIEVFIGGGLHHFDNRKDGRILTNELKDKGYKVLRDMDEIKKVKRGKLAGLTADVHNPTYPQRGELLPEATKVALNILDNNRKGFFVMIEGSQIDWGGHANNTAYISEEMLDFDRSIGEALKFAIEDKNTLVLVTADHETGGLTLPAGNMAKGEVKGAYTTGHHTAIMVPVFAYGPGAEKFMGIYENTEIFNKLEELIKK